MKQIFLITGGVIAAVVLVVGSFTFSQANKEELALTSRLQSRTQVLTESLAESIVPSFSKQATSSVQKVVNKITDKERVLGLGVFDNRGVPFVVSNNFPEAALTLPLITKVMDSDEPMGMFLEADNKTTYVFVDALREDDRVVGALMVIQNADYIKEAVGHIWTDNIFRLVLVTLLFISAIAALVYFVFIKPLSNLATLAKSLRRGDDTPEKLIHDQSFLKPISSELTKIALSLTRARSVASEEARMRLEKLDTPWTEERLKEFIKAFLKGRPIVMMSNLEPYIHKKVKDEIVYTTPASGLITALEPVMQACGGTWIAAGTGAADKLVVDSSDKVQVPPDDPRYTLKRVWLSEEEIKKYERGFASGALWPLCHLTHTRPQFHLSDWQEYKKVNNKFAKVLFKEIEHTNQPVILMQDFHFTLLPSVIKHARPDAQIGLFWHIPWPNPEIFSICPWKKEILEGMIGADVLGFHTQQFCNNFIETVSKEMEVLVDYEQFSITRNGHTCYVKPFPIGTTFTNSSTQTGPTSDRTILQKYGITTKYVGFGVERIDPIKGILERFKAIDLFLEIHPEFKEQFTFLQITAPSNQSVEKDRVFTEAVAHEVERINDKYGVHGWKPIVHVNQSHTHEEIYPLYQAADVQMVTSLHEGMNLVSKEFIASRNDEQGVLILSQFAGSARELKGALIVNPYDTRQTADALYTALTMSQPEQRRRLRRMRDIVKSYNIYRWSAEFIKAVASVW